MIDYGLIIEDLLGCKAEVNKSELMVYGDPKKEEMELNSVKEQITIRGFYQSSSNLIVVVEEDDGQLYTVDIKKLRILRGQQPEETV